MALIHRASYGEDLAEVKRLVEEYGVNPEEPDTSNGNAPPLHFAAGNGRDNVVAYLLETCGVGVDKVDSNNNRTALHWASQDNHAGCVRLLLQHGADPNIACAPYGDTPLMMAAYCGHLALMTMLLESGRCNLESKRPDTNDTAVLLAADQEKWDCVELLLSYHASPIAMDSDGRSLQGYATERQAPPYTLQLIQTAIFEPQRLAKNPRVTTYLKNRPALETRRAQRAKEASKAAAATQSEEELRQAAVAADEAAARFLEELEAEEQASMSSSNSSSAKKKKNKNKNKKGRQHGDGGGRIRNSEPEMQNETSEMPVAALEDLSIMEKDDPGTTTATTAPATAAVPDKEDDEEAFQDFLVETASDALKCPISHTLFREAVIAQDTHTYELEKLEEWIETCTRKGNPLTSPVTGAVMAPGYVRSQGMRSVVMEHIEKKTLEWKERGGAKKKG